MNYLGVFLEEKEGIRTGEMIMGESNFGGRMFGIGLC
jgi:hypothetical protein